MRIIYFDIDSLRPDRLGCYGYHRPVSPHIDAIARQGTRWTNCFASDVPCVPSRTALFSGRPGIVTGAVSHGGLHANPYPDPNRGFKAAWDRDSWMMCMRQAGYHCGTISSFAERHSAWHWTAGFNDIVNCGQCGHETVAEVVPLATRWLAEHGKQKNWFLHVNLWDVHVPYRSPAVALDGDPLPSWLKGVFPNHLDNLGERGPKKTFRTRGISGQLDTVDDLQHMLQSCDEAVFSVDQAVGTLYQQLEALGVVEDLVVIIAADHGENFGEWSAYAAHCTADVATARVPLIISGGGYESGAVVDGLCQHIDLASTICALVGVEQPESWRARPLPVANDPGRDYVVTSQLAQCVQRSVHWNHDDTLWGYLRTAYDYGHDLPRECVYLPAATPSTPLDQKDRLDDGRRMLDDYVTGHRTEHGDPWDAICAAR
jgi:arylsulfatase A-like enzyme